MIQVSYRNKILIAVEPIDFRKRLNGTAGVCRAKLELDPHNGVFYVFRNKSRTMIRIYFFDGLVEWGCDLRIACGKFPHWPTSDAPTCGLNAEQFYSLIKGGNPEDVKVLDCYKEIA